MAGSAFYSTQQAYLASVDPRQRASVVAWNSSMMNVGIAAGTSLLGAAAVGSTAFAALTAALGFSGGAVSLVLARRRHEAPAETRELPCEAPQHVGHRT
ncbi:hypothetical protein [Streptomyces decoyicus]